MGGTASTVLANKEAGDKYLPGPDANNSQKNIPDIAPQKEKVSPRAKSDDKNGLSSQPLSSSKVPGPPTGTPTTAATTSPHPPRKYSIQEMIMPASAFSPREESVISNLTSDKLTVGDIVRVNLEKPVPGESPKAANFAEGIVIEKVNDLKVKIDFGEHIRECYIDRCALIVRNYEFEIGDKVEARPPNSNLFFVGKVVKIHQDKSMDILMDGDDPDDIEHNITLDDCRKLMSRRSVVINRWKKAFMMVIAANFFKKIYGRANSSTLPRTEEEEEAEIMKEEKEMI